MIVVVLVMVVVVVGGNSSSGSNISRSNLVCLSDALYQCWGDVHTPPPPLVCLDDM